MSEFENKVVVITGAAGALGSAATEHFAEAGARLALLDVAKIEGPHYSRECDLLNPAACREAVEAIEREVGPIDVLANIAGGFAMGEAVHETSDETWDFLMGLNARSVLNMA
ncbi:MAG: SDR family NAD(P)-dependent oxidoreductase, partial [Pseudomonadota bacterium]